MAQPSIPNLVITKKDIDFGFYTYGDKTIYKIPAYAFLYLLGLYESKELELE